MAKTVCNLCKNSICQQDVHVYKSTIKRKSSPEELCILCYYKELSKEPKYYIAFSLLIPLLCYLIFLPDFSQLFLLASVLAFTFFFVGFVRYKKVANETFQARIEADQFEVSLNETITSHNEDTIDNSIAQSLICKHCVSKVLIGEKFCSICGELIV